MIAVGCTKFSLGCDGWSVVHWYSLSCAWRHYLLTNHNWHHFDVHRASELLPRWHTITHRCSRSPPPRLYALYLLLNCICCQALNTALAPLVIWCYSISDNIDKNHRWIGVDHGDQLYYLEPYVMQYCVMSSYINSSPRLCCRPDRGPNTWACSSDQSDLLWGQQVSWL